MIPKMFQPIEHDGFVLFFGAEHPLSQWHACKFTVNGVTFSSTEQFMMFAKAMHFGDTEAADKIMATDDPGEQKRLGRQVKNFVKEVWDLVDFYYVFRGNLAKFTQNNELQRYLLGTKGKHLVEASPYDRKWGVGLNANDPDITDPTKWKGENRLGNVQMQVRDVLQAAADMRKLQYAPPNP